MTARSAAPGGMEPSPGDTRPVPDPTALTTAQMLREVGALKELIGTRLDAMDKAIQLLQSHTDMMPERVEARVKHLERLQDEKFHSIETQFRERDTRFVQASQDSKTAVDAALQAAKEAVGEQNKSSAMAIAKSEAATTKQIDQIGLIVNATTSGLNDKIDDIKSRLTAIESRAGGGKEVWGYLAAGLGFLIAAVSAGVAVIVAFTKG